MNILIISDKFAGGGLETNIYTQYSTLKNNHNFSFAFGKYESDLDFGSSHIYDKFNFSNQSSILQFCDDIEQLVDVIKKDKIDVIHVHPFYSIFPAIFASQITGVPMVYTYHGAVSINFPNSINDVLLFNYAADNIISKIFCVTVAGIEAFSAINSKSYLEFLPNTINLSNFKPNTIVENKEWALISRLDSDKVLEIKKVLSILNDIDVNKLHIYGDGSEKENIIQFIRDNNLEEKVELKGYSINIHNELNGKYNGIMGLGRVVIEGLAMGYPVLIVGYGKITGLINNKLYNELKKINFVNLNIPEIKIETLNKQLKNLYNHKINFNYIDKVYKNFSSEEVYKKYIESIDKIKFKSLPVMVDFYNHIKKTSLDDLHKYNNFYDSELIYNLIKKHIEPYYSNILSKSLFVSSDRYFSLHNYIDKQNEMIFSTLSNKIEQEIKKEIRHKINKKSFFLRLITKVKVLILRRKI